MIRSVLVPLLVASSLSSSVFANTFNWQGPYAGAYLGGGYGNNHLTTDAGTVTDTSYFATSSDINAVNNAGSGTTHPSSLLGGLQAGHDWMYKEMVYGVVLDYNKMPLSSSRTINNTYPDNADQYAVYTAMKTNWLVTLRGRLGYPVAVHLPGLFYLTGGMALTQLQVSNQFSDTSGLAGTGGSNTSQNKIGWTAGAGFEVAALPHVSVNFEYLYVGVPSVKTTSTVTNSQGGFGIPPQSMSSPVSTSANFRTNIFKIGFNYRFDE